MFLGGKQLQKASCVDVDSIEELVGNNFVVPLQVQYKVYTYA